MANPPPPAPTAEPAFRVPRQARSQETLERLLDAAREVIAEVGVEPATVHEIVRRARSSVGAFYGRFSGKDALLQLLEERHWADVGARWQSYLTGRTWGDAPLEAVVADYIGFQVREYRSQREYLRALLQHARRTDNESFRERAAAFHDTLVRSMRNVLMLHRRDITHPDPLRGAVFAVRQVTLTARESVLFHDEGLAPGSVSDETLVTELTRSCLRYLGHSASSSSPSS